MLLPLVLLVALELPPGAGADELHQPQLAAGQGRVGMVYGSGSSIYFTSSADGGQSFSARVKVAEPGALALGRHRGPRVTILPHSIVITAVAGAEASKDAHAHGTPANGDLAVWRSTDGGKAWVRTGVINDVPGAAREGLHAIASDSKGNLFAAWLDLRSPGTKLYGARSADEGQTWSKNVLIYASPERTICECCDPSVAFDAEGHVHVMWRNALGGARDLYLASSADGSHFGAAQKVGEGTWKLDACPMDGGGIAIDHGRVVTAWRRGADIFVAQPGQPEVAVGQGKDVSIAAGLKGVFVLWSTGKGIQMLAPDAKAPVAVSDSGAYPVVTSLSDGSAIAAWEDKGSIRVEKLR